MCSVLPKWVLQTMWTQWFNMENHLYPNSESTFLYHNRDFTRHDILFEFQDYAGKVVTLRCNANEFLTSPWAAPNGQPGTSACFVQSDLESGLSFVDEPWMFGVVSCTISTGLVQITDEPSPLYQYCRTSSGLRSSSSTGRTGGKGPSPAIPRRSCS